MNYIFNENVYIGDQYLKSTCRNILLNGYYDENPRPHYEDGTPAHTISINQAIHKYDLNKGEFPFTTLRPIAVKNSIKEIFWIYQDQSNSLNLLASKYGITWWDEWESETKPRTIGQRYGATIKRYDLINKLINNLKSNPFGRRNIVSMWQDADLEETDGLSPCAFQTLWNVRKTDNEYFLDMTLIQRSSDYLVAGQINGIQYCALLMMIAKTCGYKPGVFAHFFQNVQIYDRHLSNCEIMLSRSPIECKPKLILDTDETDFYKFKPEDFKVVDYPLDKIKEQNPQLKFELGI